MKAERSEKGARAVSCTAEVSESHGDTETASTIGVQAKRNSIHRFSYGLYITINDSRIVEMKESLKSNDEGESVEVLVNYNGQCIEMTFDEFLSRMGFNEITLDAGVAGQRNPIGIQFEK